jgi:hypothetical protein
MTDKHLEKLDCVKTVLQSLDDNKINYKLYSNVRVEPTNQRYVNNIQLFNGSAGNNIQLFNGGAGNNVQLFNGSGQAIDQNIFTKGTGKDQSVLLSLVVDLGQ